MSKKDSRQTAVTAALACADKKASPVRIYDLGSKSSLADYAVLATVDSPPQLEAVEEEVLMRLKHDGVFCLYKDGAKSKNWKVLDYGGVLVHVFDVKTEELFAVDQIYENCKRLEWEEKPAAPAPAAKKPAAKKAPAKKSPVKKAAVKKFAAKKPAAKKTVKPAKAKAAAKKPAKKKK
ncbi:MAG TPA: ribosome silencing factor [Elusimicrobia bacterium]|nr:MAG: ribosome silencing factor [Elusimicrobia bacterium GWF2_62_30]HBA59828.1 ribosome silencing factor [Elusimicrobiota bacterium]